MSNWRKILSWEVEFDNNPARKTRIEYCHIVPERFKVQCETLKLQYGEKVYAMAVNTVIGERIDNMAGAMLDDGIDEEDIDYYDLGFQAEESWEDGDENMLALVVEFLESGEIE